MAERKATRKPAAKSLGRSRKSKAGKKLGGRPEFQPTKEQRQRVEILIGGGMAVEEVAAAMDIDKKTLSKHFAEQIKYGRSKKRAEMLEAMFNSGKGGNVSAQKAFIALNALADADEAALNPPADKPGPSPAAKALKLGKKEQAAEDAIGAGVGTEWGSDLDVETPLKH